MISIRFFIRFNERQASEATLNQLRSIVESVYNNGTYAHTHTLRVGVTQASIVFETLGQDTANTRTVALGLANNLKANLNAQGIDLVIISGAEFTSV